MREARRERKSARYRVKSLARQTEESKRMVK